VLHLLIYFLLCYIYIMNNTKLNSLGIEIPSILMPKMTDLSKWSVIACDQYTQDRDYWEKAKAFTRGEPSTLNMIFPEVFLSDDDPSSSNNASSRIADIHSTMKRYLQDGVFRDPLKGFMYIERDTPYQKKRRGLVAAIDLEKYDWHPDARPLIRCTEGTVPERLPPRCNIRRGAPIEFPHVLLLIDDEKDFLLPALGENVKNKTPCYSTQLMMNSGSVTGWFIDDEKNISLIEETLEDLRQRSVNRYDKTADMNPFLFAVGDGNHSLAAAKEIWEEYKAKNKEQGAENGEEGTYLSHPCRYALVEIENIYDPAILFEPIHRLVFNIGFDKIVSLLSVLPDFSCRNAESAEKLSQECAKPFTGNRFGIISEGRYALIETSASGISTACLQPLLDSFAGNNPQLIDYIHDEKELFRLADVDLKGKATGIILPPVQKSGLFETVARTGPLPRKSFSMGHSCEKRFYMEGRRLF